MDTSKVWTVYVLRLEHGKYYVGKTQNKNARLLSHFAGIGSAWTQKYHPIAVDVLYPNCDAFDEDKYTKIYMQRRGIEHVRGGA